MAYLKSSTIVNESITTMASQFWSNLKQMFDIDSYFDSERNWKVYIDDKRRHFDAHHTITEPLKKKLRAWVKEVPGVFICTAAEMQKLLSATNTRNVTVYNAYGTSAISDKIEVDTPNVVNLQRKVRRNTPFNRFTNATCHYLLDMGGGQCALLFFTFDDEAIKSVSVITKNQYATGGQTEGFSSVKLDKWKTVQRSEYQK